MLLYVVFSFHDRAFSRELWGKARCSFIPRRICGLFEPRTPAFSTSDPGTICSTIVFRNSQLVFPRYFTEHRETFCQANDLLFFHVSTSYEQLFTRASHATRRARVLREEELFLYAVISRRTKIKLDGIIRHLCSQDSIVLSYVPSLNLPSSSNLSILSITQKHCWRCCFRLECHVLNVCFSKQIRTIRVSNLSLHLLIFPSFLLRQNQ